MSAKEMIKGINITFNKENNNYFENEFNENIDKYLLIIALLETINDVCEYYDLDINEQLKKYIEMGSIDNYTSSQEKQIMKDLKTF